MTRRRGLLMVVILAGASLGNGGCPWKKEYEDALKRIDDLNAQIAELQKTLPEAADKIDPLAIKEVFRENKTLAAQIAALSKLIETGGPRQDNINLSTEKLKLEVIGSMGTVVVKGWIDSEDHWFVNQGLPDASVSLPFSSTYVSKWIEDNVCQPTNLQTNPRRDTTAACRPQFVPLGPPFYGQGQRWNRLYEKFAELDQSVSDQANAALRKFIARPYVLTGESQNSFYFHEQVGSAGIHWIYLRVTPLKADPQGQWLFKYRLLKERADGKVDQLALADINPLTYPAAQVGQAINAEPLRLDVRFDAQGQAITSTTGKK